MLMLTRCPACRTTFRISTDQLVSRHGQVRCGQCAQVFSALDGLVPLAADTARNIAVGPSDTDTAPDASLRDDRTTDMFDTGVRVDRTTDMFDANFRDDSTRRIDGAAGGAVLASHPLEATRPAPLSLEAAPAEAFLPAAPLPETQSLAARSIEAASHEAPSYETPSHETPSHEAPSHEAPSHEAPSHEAPSHEALSHDAPSHEALSHEALSHETPSHEAPLVDLAPRGLPLDDLPPGEIRSPTLLSSDLQPRETLDHGQHSYDGPSSAAPPHYPPSPETQSPEIPSVGLAPHRQPAHEVPFARQSWSEPGFMQPPPDEQALSASAPVATPAMAAPGSPATKPYRSSLFDSMPTPTPRRAPWLSAFGCVIALVALAAQGAWFYRNQLAANFAQAKPMLEEMCARTGCTLETPVDAAAISIESSDLQSEPANRGVLTLVALIRNRASIAQPLPHLELALTDPQDAALARKVLGPAEYAPGALPRQIGAGGEFQVKVLIDAGQVKANGYRLYAFYP